MTPEKNNLVHRICHQALALTLEDRADYLRRACGDDPALRAEVEQLLTNMGVPDYEGKTDEIPARITGKFAAAADPRGQADVAHVLFCDIVGYSIMPIEQQTKLMKTLQMIVRRTLDYRRSDSDGNLVRLPAGDGLALAFFKDVKAPVRCACEIATILKKHPEIRLRIGINSGPVFISSDINANRNVVGDGINYAQRVMDCGDAGHILVSKSVADELNPQPVWPQLLHDLGEHEVKHGVRIHLFNLYGQDVGNRELPEKLKQSAKPAPIPPPAIRTAVAAKKAPSPPSKTRYLMPALAAAIILVIAAISGWLMLRPSKESGQSETTSSLPDRSLTYFLTVQRYRNGKPYQEEFKSTGREIFEGGWKFRLHFASIQEGFLYLLHEQSGPAGGEYALLYPNPTGNNGLTAQLASMEQLETDWYVFGDEPGTEFLRVVWSASPVPELESILKPANPVDGGRIREPGRIQAIRDFLARNPAGRIEHGRDQWNKVNILRGKGRILTYLIELEHQ